MPKSSSHPAELRAYSLIHNSCIEPQALDALLDLLPAGDFPRGQHFATTRAFSAGLYIHGGVCGLRAGTRQFPWVCRLICLFARRLAPDFCFTSFSLVRDCQAGLHRDSHNDAAAQNCLFACSHFRGGELWTETSSGQHPLLHQGRLLQGDTVALPYGQPVFFSARQLLHCVLPWKGRRTILICFSVRDSARLPASDFQAAALHGFPLPQAAPSPKPEPFVEPVQAASAPTPSGARSGLGRPLGSPNGSAVPSTPSSGPWFWEVFAGSARLSLAASKAGFQVLAVDHQHNRHKPCLPLLMLDLSQPSAQDHLFRLWEKSKPSFVHIGAYRAVPAPELARGRYRRPCVRLVPPNRSPFAARPIRSASPRCRGAIFTRSRKPMLWPAFAYASYIRPGRPALPLWSRIRLAPTRGLCCGPSCTNCRASASTCGMTVCRSSPSPPVCTGP